MGISPDSKVYRFRVDEGGLLAMMPGEANYVNLHNYLTTRSPSPSPASSASLASASESLASEPASSASASFNFDEDCLASVLTVTRLVQKSKHKLDTKGMMLLLLLTVLQGAIGGVPGSPVTSPGGLTLLPIISEPAPASLSSESQRLKAPLPFTAEEHATCRRGHMPHDPNCTYCKWALFRRGAA